MSRLLAGLYYRYGRWRQARMLRPGGTQQAPVTGQGVPATAVAELE